MKIIRTIGSITFAMLAALSMLLAWIYSDTSLVEHTIENNRAIEANFKQAAAFVDMHIAQEGQTPTEMEFETWTAEFPSKPYNINGIRLDLPPYHSEFTIKHGQPPNNGYVLNYWRGEWEETYISWTKQSSLVFDPSAYVMFGNPLLEPTLFALFSALWGFLAFTLWPR